jgi:hypothetical protein
MATIVGQVSNEGERPLNNLAERIADPNEAIKRNNDALSAAIRVSLPAIVVSFNAVKQTISAQPAIKEKRVDRATGSIEWVALPVLQDIPVQFPQGGGVALTFPLAPGDEVLLVFADSCIDSWHQFGNLQQWNDRRRHDLSDAFAIPGINSQPAVITAFNTTSAELRTLDGVSRVTVGPSGVGVITPVLNIAAGAINIVTGGVTMTGESSGDTSLSINGADYFDHRHTGVTSGPSITGPIDL